MARKDQPYLPLYVQDFLTDERLAECSASSVGVYIKLMCLFHKHEDYGKILLKQKYKQMVKQTGKQTFDFASMFAWQLSKNLLYPVEIVRDGLVELLEEDVIQLTGETLSQKRMVKDAELSTTRSKTGKEGGKKTQEKIRSKPSKFAKAKVEANTEIEIENENEIDNNLKLSADGFSPGTEFVATLVLPELTGGSVIEMIRITQKVTVSPADVQDLWQAFKIQHFTGKKYYKSVPDIHSHFINWSKSQKFTNGKPGSKRANPLAAFNRSVESAKAAYEAIANGHRSSGSVDDEIYGKPLF